jgi:hypothetical protein
MSVLSDTVRYVHRYCALHGREPERVEVSIEDWFALEKELREINKAECGFPYVLSSPDVGNLRNVLVAGVPVVMKLKPSRTIR